MTPDDPTKAAEKPPETLSARERVALALMPAQRYALHLQSAPHMVYNEPPEVMGAFAGFDPGRAHAAMMAEGTGAPASDYAGPSYRDWMALEGARAKAREDLRAASQI
jgi:hypothetical protein